MLFLLYLREENNSLESLISSISEKCTLIFNSLFFKSASLLILNKYEEALKYCNYALELEPENCDANGLKQLIKYKIAQK